MSSVTLYSNFSTDNITFSDVRKNKLGGKTVYMNTLEGQKILVQLPPLRAPFGLSVFTDAKTGQSSYSLPVSLDDPATLELFKQIDAKVFQYICDNSESVLGKKMSQDVIREALYKPLVQVATKGDYAPTLKLKVLADRSGTIIPEAYDTAHNQIGFDTIVKGDRLHTIIDISQIWVVDTKCGVTVRLQQVMKLPSVMIQGFSFQVPAEDDEECALSDN